MTRTATTAKLETPLDIIWQFDYAIDITKLEDLYSKAKRDQWNAEEDIDWEQKVDRSIEYLGAMQNPLAASNFYKSLPKSTQEDLNANNAAYILSQFLHGEQGALMVAAELVDSVPDYEGKLYAATQVMDEARHVEVFEKYIRRLSKIYPMERLLSRVINDTLTAPLWQSKCVGMQMVIEGLALGTFINMRDSSQDPVLRQVLDYVIKDEARHVAFGNVYVRQAFHDMHPDEREEVEDFAYTAVTLMNQTGITDKTFGDGIEDRQKMGGAGGYMVAGYLNVITDAGVSLPDFLKGFQKDIADGWRPSGFMGRIHTFDEVVMPSLFRVGAVSERMRTKYEKDNIRISEDASRLEELEEKGTLVQ